MLALSARLRGALTIGMMSEEKGTKNSSKSPYDQKRRPVKGLESELESELDFQESSKVRKT
jgi:hypothetical protein